ncbi:MAG: YiiX/YebB-like N1pC/P60 family cysteine hydrolase [Chloroflexi bacterium]|nr:YiiX/YebB-like N1pC/P60 family cysteine hydrolase [Chloroflexota bacterium]
MLTKESLLPRRELQENDLRVGDILFVDIYDGWSQVGYWDHVAIYVGEGVDLFAYDAPPYPGPAVVEATFDGGVSYTPLVNFLERDKPAAMAVRRLTDRPSRPTIINDAVQYALAQLGNIHCGELVWRAFEAAGVDLDSSGGPLLYPDNIYCSQELEPA